MGRLVSGTVRSLTGGVTQLPRELAMEGQMKFLHNCTLGPVDGLSKRWPTNLVGQATFTGRADGAFHSFDHKGEHYVMCVSPTTGVELFNATAGAMVAVEGTSLGYLQGAITASELYSVCQYEDGAYLVNRSRKVAVLPRETTPTGRYETWVAFRSPKPGVLTSAVVVYPDGSNQGITLDGNLVLDTTTPDTLISGMATPIITNPLETVAKTYAEKAGADEWYCAVEGMKYNTNQDAVPATYIVVFRHDTPTFVPPTLSFVADDGNQYMWITSQLPQSDLPPDAIAWVTASDYNHRFSIQQKFQDPTESMGWRFSGISHNVNTGSAGTDAKVNYGVSHQGVMRRMINAFYGGIFVPDHSWEHDLSMRYYPEGYIAIWLSEAAKAKGVTIQTEATSQGVPSPDIFPCIKDRVTRPEGLPPGAPPGVGINVKGPQLDQDKEPNGYWMQFIPRNEADNIDGFWTEGVDPVGPVRLDASTFPHKLVIKESLKATFGPIELTDRKTGDEESNSPPELVGTTIRAITSYRNRLVLVGESCMTLSESGKWDNFWRTAVRTLKASDRIDFKFDLDSNVDVVLASSTPAGVLMWDRHGKQIVMTAGDGPLTPHTLRVSMAGQHNVDMRVLPQVYGGTYRYLESSASHSKLKAIYPGAGAEAVNYSEHVPTLIAGRPVAMAVDTFHEHTLVLTENRTQLAVNAQVTMAGQQVMNSWSLWSFHEDIDHISFDGQSRLHVIGSSGRAYLMVLNKADDIAQEAGRPVMLDGRTVHAEKPVPQEGQVLVRMASNRWVLGWPYTMNWSPVELAEGREAADSAHLKIRRVKMFYEKAASFQVRIMRKGRDDDYIDFTGRRVGGLEALLGEIPQVTGALSIPGFADAANYDLVVTNATPYDSTFRSLEWEGFYQHRALRW